MHEETKAAVLHLLLDHKVVREVIDRLEMKLDEFERKGEISISFMLSFLNFAKKFLDKCHHGKEEKCFFPALEKLDASTETPIEVMKLEHVEMKNYLKEIEEKLNAYMNKEVGIEDVINPSRDLIGLIRSHFFKEENILFRIGVEIIPKDEDYKTVDCYENIEKELDHEKLLKEAEEIKKS
jgi:hemerythrin-like domain-containing protein